MAGMFLADFIVGFSMMDMRSSMILNGEGSIEPKARNPKTIMTTARTSIENEKNKKAG